MAVSTIDRISAAITRIEAASADRATAADALARRHAALRTRMADAIAALDELIEQTENAASDEPLAVDETDAEDAHDG